jgi:uncharacterized DUF497 family protein
MLKALSVRLARSTLSADIIVFWLDLLTFLTYKCNYVMEFEWDEQKAALNKVRHKVDFDAATLVFYDPHRIEVYDGRNDYGEDRWATIGFVCVALLYVVYTIRENEIIRIISARKANGQEQKQYRQTPL